MEILFTNGWRQSFAKLHIQKLISTIVLWFVFGKNFAEVCLKMQLSNIIHLHL